MALFEGNSSELSSLHSDLLVADHTETKAGDANGPVRALMSALLFDGVITYLNYSSTDGRQARSRFNEADYWIHHSSAEYVFSFENVCDCLGISAAKLRLGIRKVCHARQGNKRSRRSSIV